MAFKSSLPLALANPKSGGLFGQAYPPIRGSQMLRLAPPGMAWRRFAPHKEFKQIPAIAIVFNAETGCRYCPPPDKS